MQRLIPTICLIFIVYISSSAYYYQSRIHAFDPFLQAKPPSPEFTEKSKETFRILALGGSTTFNRDLDKKDRYPGVLQDLVQKSNPELNIEVFNAGMDWYTTKHSLINYITNLREWQPDLVIVMHAINDLYRSFSDPDFTIKPYDRLWSHFYGPSINGAKPPQFARYLLGRLSNAWFSELRYRERNLPLQRYVSLNDFRRHLGYLIHHLKRDNVQVVLMTEPFLFKDNMSAEELSLLWFGKAFCKEKTGLFSYEYPSPSSLRVAMDAFNAAIKELARQENVMLIDLEPKIAKNVENFLDDVHYTAKGSHRVAELAAREIHDARLVQHASHL